jgi:hypothetical protein
MNKYFLALILSFLLAISVIVFTETTSQIAIAQALQFPPFIQTHAQEEVIIEMPNISPTVLSTNAATFVSNSS